MNIVCVSHLQWNFVFQRPQHLLSRAARQGTVLYVEEPIEVDGPSRLDVSTDATGVIVAAPYVSEELSPQQRLEFLRHRLGETVREHVPSGYVLWYYTPMALAFTQGLKPSAIVYDCMDELS